MKFSSEIPAIYSLLKQAFPHIDWDKGVAITYGDTVYSKYPLHPALAAHEYAHILQQEGQDPRKWAERYITDRHFRFEMEKDAYQKQFEFIKESVKDRNQLYSLRRRLAVDMSGPMYGNMCTLSEALEIIK